MSGIDEIIKRLCPNGVEFKTLGELGVFENIGVDKKIIDGQKKVMLLNFMDVMLNKHINKKTLSMEVTAPDSKIEKCNIKKYDVFITPTSETRDEIGFAAVADEDIPNSVYSYHIIRFRLYEKNNVIPYFISYLFDSIFLRTQIFKASKGLTRFGLSNKDFGKLTVPFPPFIIQQEIVNILDKFTELKAELESELKARQKQYDHYRDELLNFEGNEVEWKTLNEISVNLDSKRKPVKGSDRQAGKYPYYGASGIVDYVNDFIFDGDFLLISEDGANLITRNTPIAFSISGKSWVNNHAHVIKFDNYVTRRLVEIYLNSIDLNKYISTAAQPKLNQENLNKIPIPLPSFPEQERIINILDKFDSLVNDISMGLPAEIEARRKQYEYYREKLLNFKNVKYG